jgi:thiol:disulfide interchange protein DsbG
MRSILLATPLFALPIAAVAQTSCAVPAPAHIDPVAPIQIPPAITVGGPPVPLTPIAAPASRPLASASTERATIPPSTHVAPVGTPLPPRAADNASAHGMSAAEIQAMPALAHIAAAGASLSDLGMSHGLRAVYARNGGQVMVFEVTPDGQAAVAGLMTDLSVEQLRAMGGKDVSELQAQHGLRMLFLRNGTQFQVFYASPDNERVIPGVMWDASGKDLTRDQVASIPGAVPTVTIGEGADRPGVTPASDSGSVASTASARQIAEGTIHGVVGNPSAPQLWMFIDPQCSFSIRAMQQLMPYVASGKLRLNVIPLAILDGEDNGLSTRSALNLVSLPQDQLVSAWVTGRTTGTPASDAAAKLQSNMAAAVAIGLKGTPTLLWRKADGLEGRTDGLPSDMAAVISSIGS